MATLKNPDRSYLAISEPNESALRILSKEIGFTRLVRDTHKILLKSLDVFNIRELVNVLGIDQLTKYLIFLGKYIQLINLKEYIELFSENAMKTETYGIICLYLKNIIHMWAFQLSYYPLPTTHVETSLLVKNIIIVNACKSQIPPHVYS